MKHTAVSVEILSTVFHFIAPDEPDDGVFIGGDEEETPSVLLTADHGADESEDSPKITRDTIRYVTDGLWGMEDGEWVLRYRESEELGMENCVTEIHLPTDSREEVTMVRTGAPATVMIFSMKEPRQHTLYHTGVAEMPLDLCVRSRAVDVRADPAGGEVSLDYVIEMRGICTQRTVLQMRITPLPEDRILREAD